MKIVNTVRACRRGEFSFGRYGPVELQKVWYVKQKLKLIVIPVMTKVFFYWTDAMPAKCEIISRKLNISV